MGCQLDGTSPDFPGLMRKQEPFDLPYIHGGWLSRKVAASENSVFFHLPVTKGNSSFLKASRVQNRRVPHVSTNSLFFHVSFSKRDCSFLKVQSTLTGPTPFHHWTNVSSHVYSSAFVQPLFGFLCCPGSPGTKPS